LSLDNDLLWIETRRNTQCCNMNISGRTLCILFVSVVRKEHVIKFHKPECVIYAKRKADETEESTDGFNGLRPEFHLNTVQISVCIHLSLQEMHSEIM
jgi:hypothetical protein